MRLKLITTGDGSSSISLVGLDEQYHSTHGAIAESEHVFIKNGLMASDYRDSDAIKILEVGLGTGLNAFLTFLKSEESLKHKIVYHAIEPFPISNEFYDNLNYPEELDSVELKQVFLDIHQSEFEREICLGNNFNFCKYNLKLEEFDSKNNYYNLVYYDAFGPKTQPELWELSVLQKIYNVLKLGGRMVTYCAKGSVKRTLKEIGFEVIELPGPPGKREMTCAIKK